VDWIWSDHIELRMSERSIPRELVEAALESPDQIVPQEQNRTVYQKKIDGKLIRIVVEKNRLITVYITSNVSRYMKGEGV